MVRVKRVECEKIKIHTAKNEKILNKYITDLKVIIIKFILSVTCNLLLATSNELQVTSNIS